MMISAVIYESILEALRKLGLEENHELVNTTSSLGQRLFNYHNFNELFKEELILIATWFLELKAGISHNSFGATAGLLEQEVDPSILLNVLLHRFKILFTVYLKYFVTKGIRLEFSRVFKNLLLKNKKLSSIKRLVKSFTKNKAVTKYLKRGGKKVDDEPDRPASTSGTKLNGSIFPMEVWVKILVDYKAPITTAIRINKSCLDLLAPLIYKDIQGTLLVASTKKRQFNDSSYVKFGPESPIHTTPAYYYYCRLQRARKCEYEFLSVYLENGHGKQRLFNGHDKSATILTDFMDVIRISERVLDNPESIMHRYIRRVSMDVHFLDGMEPVIQNRELIEGKSLEQFCSENRCDLFFGDPQFFDIPLGPAVAGDFFNWSRVLMRSRGLLTANYIGATLNNLTDVRERNFFNKYPENIYFKEFFNTAQIFNLIEAGIRSMMYSQVDSKEKLDRLDILDYFEDESWIDMLRLAREEKQNETSLWEFIDGEDSDDVQNLQSTVDEVQAKRIGMMAELNIVRGAFCHADHFFKVITSVISGITNERMKNVESSLLITGYEGETPIYHSAPQNHTEIKSKVIFLKGPREMEEL